MPEKYESNSWYTRRGDLVRGPFPAGLISRYILLGRLLESDEVSHDRVQWLTIAEHPDLIPDVMKIVETPEDEERLMLARRHADERTVNESHDIERRVGDWQPCKEHHYHRLKSPVVEDEGVPRNHLRIVVSMLLFVTALALILTLLL